PKSDAPNSSRKKPSDNQKSLDQPSPTTLGETAPASSAPTKPGAVSLAAKPVPTPDRVAPTQVPVPQLGQAQWSKSFPDVRIPALVSISPATIDKLQEGRQKSGEWIEEQIIERTQEKAIDRFVDRLPLSDALKEQVKWQSENIQNYKKLF